jgi:hypothetical protein
MLQHITVTNLLPEHTFHVLNFFVQDWVSRCLSVPAHPCFFTTSSLVTVFAGIWHICLHFENGHRNCNASSTSGSKSENEEHKHFISNHALRMEELVTFI